MKITQVSLLLSLFLLSLFPGIHSRADVEVDDFQDVSDWTGLQAETVTTKVGQAGRWANTVSTTAIMKNYDPPLDTTGTTHLGFWLYSEVANGAELELMLDSTNPETEGIDYYFYELTIDWTGWRWFWLSKEHDLGIARTPLGWDKINSVRVYSTGWGHVPVASTNLVLDEMRFASGVLVSVGQEKRWDEGDFVTDLELTLRNPDEEAKEVQISCTVPSGFGVLIVPEHLSLAGSETGLVEVTITLPEELLADFGAYAAFEVELLFQSSVNEFWNANIAIPPPSQDHPRVLATAADFERMNAWAQKYSWAAQIRNRIISRADSWRSSYLNRFGLDSFVLPPEGGQWSMHYVCPTHGTNLTYSPPMTHHCQTGDHDLSGWPYDQVVYTNQLYFLADAVQDTGNAYCFTGEEAYARDGREILLALAAAYQGYVYHDKDGINRQSGGRAMAQTLGEAVWMIPLAWGYDCLLSSGIFSAGDRDLIETDLFLAGAETILRNDAGLTNWQAWHNAAFAAIGRALGDDELVSHAIHGQSGFYFHMENSVLSDGFWYESSWGYHFYTLSPMTYLAEMGERGGFPLYSNEALRSMYAAPLLFAPPDLVLPAFNDAGIVDIRSQSWGIDAAYPAYQDPLFVGPLTGQARRETSLFWGAEFIPETAAPTTESLLFEATGYAILRGGSAGDPWYLALDYGEHGGWHGHYDKLGFVFFAGGKMQGLDPGSHSYALPLHDTWDRSTVAHNTVVADETDQGEATGSLERFVSFAGNGLVHATAGEAYANTELRRSLFLGDGYLLDVVDAASLDGQSRKFDWFYHNEADLSSDLNASSYDGFPATGGYQHLEGNLAEVTGEDRHFVFDSNADATYPGGYWKNKSEIVFSYDYSEEQAFSGSSSGKCSYDFSAVSGYGTFISQSLAEVAKEAPLELAVQVYGDNSGNRIRLRIVDASGENFVSPTTNLNFSGWQEVRVYDPTGWSSWNGNANGVIELPLSYVSFELIKLSEGAPIGSLYLDNWRLTFAESGEVVVEDYERIRSGERIWIKGQSDSTFVTGTGIGPDLTEPVPYIAVRRSGTASRFIALHEPLSVADEIRDFALLPTDAASADHAFACQVDTDAWSESLLLLGTGAAGQNRSFGEFSSDGVLARVRKNGEGNLVCLAAAEATEILENGVALLQAPASFGHFIVSFSGTEAEIVDFGGVLTGLRLRAPLVETLLFAGQEVPFTRSGDEIVISSTPNIAPVLAVIGERNVEELTELVFQALASDGDQPEGELQFFLEGAVPAGAAISVAGEFRWIPGEAQGPAEYRFDVVVSDGTAEDRETITIMVREVAVPPELAPIGPQEVDELTELSFTALASDVDLPADTLTFSLDGVIPPGAAISSEGEFRWTPSEEQGAGEYSFDVVVSDGVGEDRETITVTVYETSSITLTVHPGWNLFSLPFETTLEQESIGEMLQTSDGTQLFQGALYTWDCRFLRYRKLRERFVAGQGFWLFSGASEMLTSRVMTGRCIPVPFSLQHGWNLFGVTEELFGAQVDGKAFFWDAEKREYVLVADEQRLSIGCGYWGFSSGKVARIPERN